MAYEYYIDPDLNCDFVRHFGEYELDEEQHHLRDLMARDDFRPDCNILRVMEGTAMPAEYSFE